MRPRKIWAPVMAVLVGMAGCSVEETPVTDGAVEGYPDYTVASCAPGACSGCCQQNSCLPGTDNKVCGFSGVACQACQGDQVCKAGICSALQCDATSCATGCCDSAGECKKGTEDTACGTGGQVCQTCTSSEICSNNQCGAKGPTMYKTTLVSAKVTGSSFIVCIDINKCDLYVILKVGNATAKSSVKIDTNDPSWKEFMLVATEADIIKKFAVEVRDEDPIGSGQVGKCTPKITAADLQAGTFSSDCGNAKQLTWSFQKIKIL
jgi:hypothetical protein